ncbi:cell wall hydrolase [Novosphingobium sp. Gsoil 351]|uniref:cell wall hydrolase n=1 Tax=Novosphingobium sp. Gsoil 351 TaxID=2675225 RepID=UPI001E4B3A55|nr:cell wall hydrolase [Novosphingobium sp. Gsoil 351]
MHDATVLEFGGETPFADTRAPAQRRIRLIAMVAVLALVALATAEMLSGSGFAGLRKALGLFAPGQTSATVRVNLEAQRAVAKLTEGAQATIVVQGEAAKERNALIPLSSAPLQQARSFLISKAVAGSGAGPMGNALTCLTQAVYYEAANEPMTGRRAVAQVVLNRMRHPAYPKSVCGVVYQGWERTTGCQFSFTCDGSLLRHPAARSWAEAQDVARAALSGYVEPSVGTATFYHADYVLPKWAFTLNKIQQIGAHIFYRFPGAWGNTSTFNGGYSGVERIPDVNYALLQARLNSEAALGGAGLPADIIIPPDPTDRRTATDVGGRINPLKQWRLNIPAPGESDSHYQAALDDQDVTDGPLPISNSAASASE